MEDLRVAAVAMCSLEGEKEKNLARMRSFVRRAAARGARMVCFPELCISGYSLRPDIQLLAEEIPGPSTRAVLAMARESGVAVLAGLAERGAGGTIYISHLAAGPRGLIGVYRKLHLGRSEEKLYQPGRKCPVFHFQGSRFGIELCFDGHFPELSAVLALKGAEVLFFPHASPRESSPEKRRRWLRYLAARAYDNSVFVVACNQAGGGDGRLRFPGTILILNPRGKILARDRGGGEGMVLSDLKAADLAAIRQGRRGFFLARRRPELYRELTRDRRAGK